MAPQRPGTEGGGGASAGVGAMLMCLQFLH